MRDLFVPASLMIGFMVLLLLFASAFQSAGGESANAMEVARLKNEAAQARKDAKDAHAALQKAQTRIQELEKESQELKKKVGELKKRLTQNGR